MKQTITPRHYSRTTTTILDLQPPQLVIFILHLPKNISPLILDQKSVLSPLPLPMNLWPMPAILPTCPPWTLKHSFQIPLRSPKIFSQHTHLTGQMNILPQFRILHQLTLPELNPLDCQKLLHLIYQKKNLHKFLLLTENSTPPVDISQSCLI